MHRRSTTRWSLTPSSLRLMVLGEAAKNVDAELRASAPGVRWSDSAGLRDVIAHQYFRIQTQIIEDTVREELPNCGKPSKLS